MNFEVKHIEYINKQLLNPLDPTTLIQNVNITMGVVGNPYQMNIVDTYQVAFPAIGIDAQQIEAFVDAEATRLAHLKYPNI